MVYFVGAGPGDPELITVRGQRCVQQADVIVYDRLVSPQLLAQAPPGAELHYVGKTPGSRRNHQEDINRLLVRLGATGKRVVRLKGGDPFVFGRGWEECESLREVGIAFEVVPGLSSALAVPALAGIPVTHRGLSRSFAVVTAHTNDGSPLNYTALVGLDTLVVLMGRAQLETIAAQLIAAGKSPNTPVACVERGTTPDQRVLRTNLCNLSREAADFGLESPVTVVIGQVAALQTSWQMPLLEVI